MKEVRTKFMDLNAQSISKVWSQQVIHNLNRGENLHPYFYSFTPPGCKDNSEIGHASQH